MPFLAPIGAAVLGTTGTAAATGFAASLVGTAVVAGGGLALAGLGKSVFGSGSNLPDQAGITAPSTKAAQETSRADAVEEQRSRLRGSKTILTSPGGLLAQAGQSTGKTLLGA